MSKTNIKILTIILSIIMMFALCMCNDSDAVSNKNVPASSSVTKLKDMKGHDVVINEKVHRIIPTYRPALYFILALGGIEDLASSINVKVKPLGQGQLFSNFYPEIEKLPRIKAGAGNLNIEEIASLKPDLVVLYPKNSEQVRKQLIQLDIPVLIIDPENREKIIKTINILGKAMGVEDRAAALVKTYENTLGEIKTKVEKQHNNNTVPKVYYVDMELTKTISGQMFQSQMINDAGGYNVSSDMKGWKQNVSIEQIVKWNPETIIIASYSKIKPDDILENPVLQSVSAIKHKRVYKMPSNIDPWDFPSPNAFLGTYWIAHKLYPELITEEDLKNKTNDFYKEFYGKTFKDAGGEF